MKALYPIQMKKDASRQRKTAESNTVDKDSVK
jgi:hypothetical protein